MFHNDKFIVIVFNLSTVDFAEIDKMFFILEKQQIYHNDQVIKWTLLPPLYFIRKLSL